MHCSGFHWQQPAIHGLLTDRKNDSHRSLQEGADNSRGADGPTCPQKCRSMPAKHVPLSPFKRRFPKWRCKNSMQCMQGIYRNALGEAGKRSNRKEKMAELQENIASTSCLTKVLPWSKQSVAPILRATAVETWQPTARPRQSKSTYCRRATVRGARPRWSALAAEPAVD